MASSDLSLLEDFGQRVDLTCCIHEVLVNYPEGTTVLKELIQNADNAGTTKVRRRHGAASLLSPTSCSGKGAGATGIQRRHIYGGGFHEYFEGRAGLEDRPIWWYRLANFLHSPDLTQWQGPALLAYNDAVFTGEDFVSISRIRDSKKQGRA